MTSFLSISRVSSDRDIGSGVVINVVVDVDVFFVGDVSLFLVEFCDLNISVHLSIRD